MAQNLPLKHSAPIQDEQTRREEYVLMLLREVYLLDHLEQFALASKRIYQNAVERRCQQEITIILSDKGFPFVMSVKEEVRFAKPLVLDKEERDHG